MVLFSFNSSYEQLSKAIDKLTVFN